MPADPLWHQLDLARPAYADVQPIVSEHAQHNARVRTYALPNSELRVAALPCGGVRLRLRSGKFDRTWAFAHEEPRIAWHFAKTEKYMLVLETVTTLPGVHAAFAQDTSEGERMAVDLILQPEGAFMGKKFRLMVDIAADPALLATVAFFETFRLTPTDRPVVRRRNAKHFASAAALARFVQVKWGLTDPH
jgi:hypothetical protein